MISNRAKVAASLYATMSISFWGISFVSTKAVLDKLDPYTLLVIRFGIGALFLCLLLLLMRSSLKIPLTYIPHLIVLGIIGVFVHQILQATALLTIHASDAGWLISFSPVFTVMLSMIFLHEKITLPRAIGIMLAVFGVLLVTTSRNGQSLHFALNIGFILMILSTFNWAVFSILLKRLRIPLPSLVITFYMSLLGFVLTLPILIKTKGWVHMSSLTTVEWAHLLFLGIFVSGVAYWYWGKAHEVLEASQASVFMYLEPVATLIAAILLLQEKIIFISVLGGIIIIVGVVIVNGQRVLVLQNGPWRKRK
ncbi:DMT family transporter [Pontibacillus yanchengensis]|uniref:Multidrug transporter n=1 Tax=Pontibacillus yanchengensis Y32 TaxID=1385514 RepID=A0A0A2TE56_9BACI|nr:DMT family transporter [Pontibacillus yanchengensis]KGP74137.1 multidrug transporter [Pontibacillus yanchengensis Y32]